MIQLLCFSAGILLVSFFAVLPPWYFGLILIPLAFLSYRSSRYWLWLFSLTLGMAYGSFTGHQLISHQLPEVDSDKNYIITGRLVDLPVINERQIRFWLDVQSIRFENGDELTEGVPERVQLSWYISSSQVIPNFVPGDSWLFHAKLQRPRNFVNPAGFDYQLWLLRKGVGATGYVLKGNNHQIEYSQESPVGLIHKLRYRLQHWLLQNSSSSHKGILIALLIGDSSNVDQQDWQLMQKTGTSHLIAISGLHVGFLAIVGYYLGLFFGRFLHLWRLPWPAQFIAYLFAIVFSGFYSALAGFNIPTVRTLLMLSIFYGLCLRRRDTPYSSIFCLALVLVLIVDPLAAYDMGFWLSFGAVAFLLMGFSG